MPHAEVIGTVEHAAERVSPAVDKVAVSLGSGNEHARTVKVFGKQGFRRFGTEVAEKHDQCITAGSAHVCNGFLHIKFIFDRHWTFIQLALISGFDRFAAFDGKLDREAIARHGYDAEFDFGDIVHRVLLQQMTNVHDYSFYYSIMFTGSQLIGA